VAAKLCFSIPELEADTHTHHLHIYELLEELGKRIEIFVVVDKPTVNRYVLNNAKQIYFTKFKLFALRKLEQFLVFCYARLKGYRAFYSHYSLWNALLATFITKIFGGKSYIWSCHGYKRATLKEISSIATLKGWLNGILQVLTFKLVDHVVTGTSSVVSHYVKEFHVNKEKFIIIPNWVNLKRFKTADSNLGRSEDGRRRVTFIHSLTKERGASYLPKIIKTVTSVVEDVSFTIIGDGAYCKLIQEEIRRNSIQDRVKFTGYVSNKEIPKYLSSTHLLIAPSENEGFPRILLEAMAMGVPFVATNAGGVMDIVVPLQSNYIVPVRDVDTFSEKVIELLQNDAMREKLRQVGLERVKEYTLEKAVERFKQITS
jgi:glycosyltransferase involved in cell wall biosynthesis